MKGYNKIKNMMISCLMTVIYHNVCITSNNNTFAIAIGMAAVLGCVYFFMSELDKWCAKRRKYEK